jgi:hypothetical protein
MNNHSETNHNNRSNNSDDSEKNESEKNESEIYEIKTKMCKRLSKEFDLPIIEGDILSYQPSPKQHGLINSDVIIPSYKILKKKPTDIDFYELIKDDLRNYRDLNKYQLQYIHDLNDECKYEIILLMNDVINTFSDIMNSS